ncbi:hypothetical protein C8Q77DRAFT_1045217 [Trametes polyzona]|nr:hypothetical protein C8Q77DRAFT_1045217 [Trametes polyzona]
MSADDSAADGIPLNELGNLDALLNAFALAHLLGAMSNDDAGQGEHIRDSIGTSQGAPPPMPTPMHFPQPTHHAPPMPEPMVCTSSQWRSPTDCRIPLTKQPPPPPPPPPPPSVPHVSSPTPVPAPQTANVVPVRPPSPSDTDVARSSIAWRLFTAPLYARLSETLYVSKDSLPEPTTGNVSYLKLAGYGTRNSVENMCALVRYLEQHPWNDQLVDRFIAERMQTSHWPAKLANQPHAEHVKYAWHLMDGLLCVIGISCFFRPTPPSTFAGAVNAIFAPVPAGAVPPPRFSFSARELVEEDFLIQPTHIILDHLKLVGNAVSVYTLATEQMQLLIGYDDNRAARAVGMADYGHEIMQSFGALVNEEFREKYRLPISLGMFKINDERVRRGQYDDLTVVSGIIEKKHKDPAPYHPPKLLAGRVWAIEQELRRRRRWHSRLWRDIRKRKKEEPWMFWGTVLAVFFGICTVIQTVTSVWSLMVSLQT